MPRRPSWYPTHTATYWRTPGADPVTIPVRVEDGVGTARDGERIVRLVDGEWHWARAGHPGVSRLEVVRPAHRPPRAGVVASVRIDLKATPDEAQLWRDAAEAAGVGLRRWIADQATAAARKSKR